MCQVVVCDCIDFIEEIVLQYFCYLVCYWVCFLDVGFFLVVVFGVLQVCEILCLFGIDVFFYCDVVGFCGYGWCNLQQVVQYVYCIDGCCDFCFVVVFQCVGEFVVC